jgi:hypothetical protein
MFMGVHVVMFMNMALIALGFVKHGLPGLGIMIVIRMLMIMGMRMIMVVIVVLDELGILGRFALTASAILAHICLPWLSLVSASAVSLPAPPDNEARTWLNPNRVAGLAALAVYRFGKDLFLRLQGVKRQASPEN